MKKVLMALSIVGLASVVYSPSASAAVDTCTWTGAVNTNMSNGGNWTGCDNSGVPENGDALVFPRISDDPETVTNDLTGVSFSSITVGTTGQVYEYEMGGAQPYSTVNITLEGSGRATFGSLTFKPFNNTSTATVNGSSELIIDTTTHFDNVDTFNLTNTDQAGGQLTLNGQATGDVNHINAGSNMQLILNATAINQPETISVGGTDSMMALLDDKWFGTTSTTIDGGATLYVKRDAQITTPLVFADQSRLEAWMGGSQEDTITISGDTILNGAVSYSTPSYITANVKFTGNMSGSGSISPIAGAGGNVVVQLADGKTNESGTPDGTTKPELAVTTYSDTTSSPVNVFANNLFIIDGGRGAVTVYANGVLKGNGVVGNLTVNANGILAPGNSPGCLTANGATNLSGTYEVELGGTTACTEYDQLVANGSVTVGGTLSLSRYNSYEPTTGTKYIIINNDGSDAVTGTFAGLAEGATISLNGYTFTISYVGGDGNDVELTVTDVSPDAPTDAAQASNAGGVTPGTPNTGMQLLLANPLATFAGTVLSAGSLIVLGRKYSLFNK